MHPSRHILKVCPQCGKPQNYFSGWDAFFCAPCNIWLTPVCSGESVPRCEYRCWERPVAPLSTKPYAVPVRR